MATVNYASREICCKIVYYGAGFCGKTASLQYIHKTVPEQYRGELISLATEQDRTLFFDFLALELGSVGGFDTKFQLYTVPGQVFYDATRKLVLRGVDGIVFVVDSLCTRLQDNLDSLENLKEHLAEYGYELGHIPWVIQYNKRDLPDIFSIAELEKTVNADKVPSFESVAITGKGVKETLKAIAGLVLARVGSLRQAPRESAKVAVGAPRLGVLSTAAGRQEQSRSATPGDRVQTKARFVAPQRSGAAECGRPAGSFYVRQKCDVRWVGIRIGSALLDFINRSNIDGRGAYQLSGTIKMLGLLRRYRLEFLAYCGDETFASQEGENAYFAFSNAQSDGTAKKSPVSVWVRNSRDRTFFVRYKVARFDVLISPEGKHHILRQR